MDQPALSTHWHDAARHTVRKTNLAWWFEKATPLCVLGGITGFAVIFLLRSRHHTVTMETAWPWLLGGASLIGGIARLMARPKFINIPQAFVRLESKLRLHNALTAASAGIGPWPEPPAILDDHLRWSAPRLGGPVLAAAACVALALFCPVPRDLDAAELKVAEPPKWQEMENTLKTLEEEKVADPEKIEELKQQIEKLRAEDAKEWYSHNSLEATDHLQEQLNRSVDQMGKDLESAERALNGLQNYGDQLDSQTKDKLLSDYDAAMKGMDNNEALKLDPSLAKALAGINPKDLKSLSKEQLDKVREEMKKKSGA